ncbi:MAG: molecular chaperone HtpG [Clostridia bacterium]|nr:molecular chaperone HtpG [Clostridia bacterium]
MKKKQFKSESKRLMDLMINSIYTHKEIFLREIISNASDALDKLYFKSLTDSSVGLNADDFVINIDIDKDSRIIRVSDNGCGMTEDELDSNLGTIAKSGSLNFKTENDDSKDIDIIGQFGVGFYSAFMVSDKVTVYTKAFGSDIAYIWESNGTDGYRIGETEKDGFGTVVEMHIKEDTDDENYSKYLDKYTISSLVKKYSDYIRHPIKMDFTESKPVEGEEGKYEDVTETRVLNSRIPIWKKNKSEVKEEDYNNFYKEKFFDFEDPLKVIHSSVEGNATYKSLLYIPAHAPFNYYTKDYEKGLQLYSKGVLIMDKCPDLLPDYFSFVKGLIDSEDLSLNISREMLQHDSQLKLIAKTVEKKIKSELEKMLKTEREKYEKFFKEFGTQIKFGIYNMYGLHKDELKDLLIFKSSYEDKMTTIGEYVERLKEEDKKIYYACGETEDKIKMLPQYDAAIGKGIEVLLLTDYVDEFVVKTLHEYEGREFANICDEDFDLTSDEEKESLKKSNDDAKDLLASMKEALEGKVVDVRFTNKLSGHPVCLSTEGEISLDMEKTLNSLPGARDNKIKADIVLEINIDHPVAQKLINGMNDDKDEIKKYAVLLYDEACLIAGRAIDNPVEHSKYVCELLSK